MWDNSFDSCSGVPERYDLLFGRRKYFTKTCIMTRYSNWHATIQWLYDEHFDTLYRKAFHALFEKNKAADIVQEVFTRLLEKERPKMDRTEATKYMYTSFRNLLIDHIRRDTKFKQRDIENINPAKVSSSAHQEEDLVRMRSQEKKLPLPDADASIFRLAHIEKLSDQQIADKLQLKINVVRYSLVKSRKALEKILIKKHGYTREETKALLSRKKG